MSDQGGPEAVPARHRRVVTIPNAISALRLVMAAALPFVAPDWRLPLLVAGALSDWFDGLAANMLHSRSVLGQLLDPIADKALFLSALLTLVLSGEIQWWHAVLVLLRDVIVLIAVLTTIVRREWADFARMKPTVLGKVTTVLVFAWLVAMLLPWSWAESLRQPAFIIACIGSAVAAADYLRRFILELRQLRHARPGNVDARQ